MSHCFTQVYSLGFYILMFGKKKYHMIQHFLNIQPLCMYSTLNITFYTYTKIKFQAYEKCFVFMEINFHTNKYWWNPFCRYRPCREYIHWWSNVPWLDLIIRGQIYSLTCTFLVFKSTLNKSLWGNVTTSSPWCVKEVREVWRVVLE